MSWQKITQDGHIHANKTTLDKLSEQSGNLLFNGNAIGGGGGETHTHANKSSLDKIGDSGGRLTYSGTIIEGHTHSNKLLLDQLGYDGQNLLYNGLPLVSGGEGGTVVHKPSLNDDIIYDFDINNILVSEKQIPLTIPVAAYNSGSNAVVHPSILYFDERWNDYHYWMCINPYAGINFENPVIMCSNDGINWVEPAGITNPIDPMPTTGFYSDVHLFRDKDGKTIHCLNRHYEDNRRRIYIYSSIDGVNWTDKTTILESTDASFDFLSPSILLDKGQYFMFTVDEVKLFGAGPYNEIDVYTTFDVRGQWQKSHSFTVPIKPSESIWHLEIRRLSGNYYMLLTTGARAIPYTDGRLYIYKSKNLIDWEAHETPISSMFDGFNKAVYKCSMTPAIDEKGLKFRLWYNVTGGAANWDLNYTEILSKPRKNFISRFGRTLEFKDNFDDSGLVGWTKGTNPGIVISNGIADTVGRTGIDPVYKVLGVPNYIVDLQIEALTFDNAAFGSLFYVGSSSNNDWDGMFLGYEQRRLRLMIRKGSNTVRSYYLKEEIQKGDIVSFEVNNTEKYIRVYLNGNFKVEYLNQDTIMDINKTRIGFKFVNQSTGRLAVQGLKVYS